MFGGLYGDLPQAKGSSEGDPNKQPTGWALANTKQAAPRSTVASLAPPSLLRAGRGGRGRTPATGAPPLLPAPTHTTHIPPQAVGALPPAAGHQQLHRHQQRCAPCSTPLATRQPPRQSAPSHLPRTNTTLHGMKCFSHAPRAAHMPMRRPNDYEQVLKNRERHRIEAEKEVERLRELERQQQRQVVGFTYTYVHTQCS